MSSIYFYALFIITRVFPTFIGSKVNVFLDKPPRQSNQDTCLSNPFPKGNSRKYPYHTMDCFHILNFPAFGISKMGYQPSPQNFVIINLSISGLAVTPNPTRFKKLKWHPRWKKACFALNGQIIYGPRLFSREKKKDVLSHYGLWSSMYSPTFCWFSSANGHKLMPDWLIPVISCFLSNQQCH